MQTPKTAFPLVWLIIFSLSFVSMLVYIAVARTNPTGELEIRFRYLEKHYNRNDNGTAVNISVNAGSSTRNVTLLTREARVKSVLMETAATTPITVSVWDHHGFSWQHTVTVLDMIDDHWIDMYVDYQLADKYSMQMCFTWSRINDKS